MFVVLFLIFLLAGSILMFPEMVFPFYLLPQVVLGMKIIGLILIWSGGCLLVGRLIQTGGGVFTALPTPGQYIDIHLRRGRNAKIIKGKLTDLEHLQTKGKLYKDTGGGFRIGGHDVRVTHETIDHNIPMEIAQYVHQIKLKYHVNGIQELTILYDKLKALHRPIPGMTLENQLELIPELEALMNKPETKQQLVNMDLEHLQNMAELLYDGQTIHYEDYERFTESTSPNELDSFVEKHVNHRLRQNQMYTSAGTVDWVRWAPTIFMGLIVGAIAFVIITGN